MITFSLISIYQALLNTSKTGRRVFKSRLIRVLIVMKCEGFSQITDLVDYLHNKLVVAYFCGFDITKNLFLTGLMIALSEA